MADFLFVYVTCPDKDMAEHIGRQMVEANLAACANIIPGMKSLYRWQGKIETADESVLVLKATQKNYAALESAVRNAHPYDVPCIVALPITQGHAPYLQWIEESILP